MNFLYLLPGAFFAPVIHEFVKARVSAALGDPTPKKSGFITWNPFKFFEPIGFFLMLFFQVGWGQPVTTSPLYYRNKRKGIIQTYTAPTVANLLVGMLVIMALGFLGAPLLSWAESYGAAAKDAMTVSLDSGMMLNWPAAMEYTQDIPFSFYIVLALNEVAIPFARANIGLALFNLIPVFPMAANKLLHLFVSPETSMRLNHYEKPLQLLLLLMIVIGVVQTIIFPIREMIISVVSF
ncbi:MAG: site-2 protease family protein [Defluviitaleaceae bacterium]|nr:site-2 protease family protein [Defluviitaleaceae bacterium]